jgi:hypothetical protein
MDGGALYLSNSSVTFDFAGCLFADCRTAGSGGAICMTLCLSFSMNETSAVNCTADSGAFCLPSISSTRTGSLGLREPSITSCASRPFTLSLDFGGDVIGTVPVVESLNSSLNDAIFYRSGLFATGYSNFSLRFSAFSANVPATGFFRFSAISCLALRNNSCQSCDHYLGLVGVNSDLTLSNCVFQSNASILSHNS